MRLMTDGAMSYRNNRSLRDLLSEHNIRHIVTPPSTTHERQGLRFHQTMERESAEGPRYRPAGIGSGAAGSSVARAGAPAPIAAA